MKILTITGMTCSGKSTLERALLDIDIRRIGKIVSHTTRKPRADEIDGVDYHFVDRDFFLTNRESFIEFVEFDGNFYGAHQSELERLALFGIEIVVFVAEPLGAIQIKEYCAKQSIAFHPAFIDVPAILRFHRLLKRFASENLDGAGVIRYAKRLDAMENVERFWHNQWLANVAESPACENALHLDGSCHVETLVSRVLSNLRYLEMVGDANG